MEIISKILLTAYLIGNLVFIGQTVHSILIKNVFPTMGKRYLVFLPSTILLMIIMTLGFVSCKYAKTDRKLKGDK